MPIFSKQKLYCRACGAELFVSVNEMYGGEVCNRECYRELEWKRTLSILGKEYCPRPKQEDENGKG